MAGVGCALDRFNGMFALAVIDTETGETVLARDQFGIKPLYLACVPDRVLFASELKPLLATGLVGREPDEQTLFRYLRFRAHDDTDRTFFAGISRLLPGELARVAPDGTVVREVYTSLHRDLRELAEEPGRPYGPVAAEEFADTLQTAIRRRLVADVAVGTALSGGLDSSTVVATVNRLLLDHDDEASPIGPRQQSFSAVFPGELNDEERYVDAVAAGCRSLQAHKVRPTPAGFLVRLRELRRLGDHRRLIMESVRAQDVLWRLGRFTIKDRLAGRRTIDNTRSLLRRSDIKMRHTPMVCLTALR